jgi:predicted outer membrane repeat protein
MSQRQRRRKDQRRKDAQRLGPSRRQVAAGATIAMGATLAATGSAQAATITVSNLNDSGPGSLRQAILDANDNGGGSDDIVFASGLSGTIDVGSTDGSGLYPGTAMNIQGPGAGQITLRGTGGVDYVVYTGLDFGGYDANPGDPITISGLTITGGDATGKHSPNYIRGGGIFNKDATLTVANSVISNNYALDDGGGIYTSDAAGSVTVVNSTISGNRAGASTDGNAYGGGIYSQDSPVVTRNSTVSGNNSGGDGGGIYMSSRPTADPSLTVENSTVANNTAGSGGGDDGGGIWLCCGDGDQSLTLKSSTITGNRVGGGSGFGGGLVLFGVQASNVNIQSSIIANNHGTTGNDIYSSYGGQLGFSLVKELNADSTDTGYSFATTGPNIIGQDPQLGGLADNGGPTQTELPAATSPVIDKGNAFGLNSDQRGVLRPIDFPAIPNTADGADMGAVELQPSNAFKLGKLKRNKKKGTAKQVVILPLPDAGSVTIQGKGLKSKTRFVTGTDRLKLPVLSKGKKRKALNRSGKAKIKAKVTYSPIGNTVTTLKKKLKLLKKR